MNLLFTICFIAGLYLCFFLIERAVPLRHPKARLLTRLPVNLALSAGTFAAAAVFVRPVIKWLLPWTAQAPFGLVHMVPLPGAVEFILGFLLLDLSFYYWHRANHRIPLLWRFHNVHHLDPDLDVSTGFRFHFVEVVFSTVFRAAQIGVIGPAASTFAVYELVFQANTLFHHSNIRLPLRIERLLNAVLVTPRMHGIHHSQVCDETDANYGVVLPWWDRLHRTLRLRVPQSRVVIGIPGYAEPDDNGLWRCLTLPFRAQRDYWRTAAGDQCIHRGAEFPEQGRNRLTE